MATTTVDTLITRYVLDDTKHHAGAKRVVADTNQVTAAQTRAKRSMSDMNAGFARFGSALTMAATVAAAGAAALVAFGSAVIQASWAAASKAADFEALENSLRAVSESAQVATKDMQDLRDIAKSPGIDIEGAVKGLVGLKFAGIDSDAAKEIIRQVGNANATAGGGRSEFEAILRAIKQIAGKEFLQGDELLQLSEAGVPAQSWIKEIFGTANTEELKKAGITSALVIEALTLKMAELPRAAGGAKNELENFRVSIDQAFVGFGKGILSAFTSDITAMTSIIEDLTGSGVFTLFGEQVASQLQSGFSTLNMDGLADVLIEVGGIVVDVTSAFSNLIDKLRPLLSAVFGPIATVSGMLSGGAGAAFTQEARERLDKYRQAELARQAERDQEERERQARLAGRRIETERKLDEAKEQLTGEATPDAVTKEIASNTRRTAEATQKLVERYEQTVFGGSELGRHGITAREVKEIRRGAGGSSFDAKIEEATRLIADAVLGLQARTIRAT